MFCTVDEKSMAPTETETETEGAFLVTDNRVLNGQLSRSLRLFARTAHSAHSLCSALLHSAHFACLLTPFKGLLTNFTHFLVGQSIFMNICSQLHTENALSGNKHVFCLH